MNYSKYYLWLYTKLNSPPIPFPRWESTPVAGKGKGKGKWEGGAGRPALRLSLRFRVRAEFAGEQSRLLKKQTAALLPRCRFALGASAWGGGDQ